MRTRRNWSSARGCLVISHDNNNVAPRMGVNFASTIGRSCAADTDCSSLSRRTTPQQSYSMVHRFEYQIPITGVPISSRTGLAQGRAARVNWADQGRAGRHRWRARATSTTCRIASNVRSSRKSATPAAGRHTAIRRRLGVQRQIGETMSVEANYVHTAGRLEETVHNANLSYNPATGANYPFSDISRRPFPEWGVVLLEFLEGWSNYNAADLTFTKRFSNRWQGTATYTLGYFKDGLPVRPQWYSTGRRHGAARRRLPLAPDLGGDYGYAGSSVVGGVRQAGDQRHRAVLNGVWDVGYGFQVSGIYFYGSGERFGTNTGVDRRNEGSTPPPSCDCAPMARSFRARPSSANRFTAWTRGSKATAAFRTRDGRRAVRGVQPLQSRELRVVHHQREQSKYGKPSFNANVAYQPRMLQLGFRVAFGEQRSKQRRAGLLYRPASTPARFFNSPGPKDPAYLTRILRLRC